MKKDGLFQAITDFVFSGIATGGVFLGLASCAGSPDSSIAMRDREPKTALGATFLAKSPVERVSEAIAARLATGVGWGYAAAVRDGGKTTLFARGRRSLEPVREISPRDLFEIGSVSKLFTGILLHLAALEGKLALADPLSRFFPELAGKAIGAVTLRELGLHSSGLPSAPPSIRDHDFLDPWKDWTEAEIRTPLAETPLAEATGTSVDNRPARPRAYSNWGYLVLGRVLEIATARPYGKLLREKILGPLRMPETGIDLLGPSRKGISRKGKSQSRLVPAFTLAGDAAAPWEFSGFAAATGGIESTSRDMGKFLAALDGVGPAKLVLAIRQSRESGVGWDSREGETFFWKNGGTSAYSAILAWDEPKRRGFFVTGNSAVRVDDMAVVALGYDDQDSFLESVRAAPPLTEATRKNLRRSYRVVTKDGQAVPVSDPAKAGWNFSLRKLETIDSFGHLRARLDFCPGVYEGALILGTKDSDGLDLFDGDGTLHRLELTRKGAELTIRGGGGAKETYELEAVETPVEKYPSME